MTGPLIRWNDERLDDLARRVDEAVKIQHELTALQLEFVKMRGQSETCLDEIRHVRQAQEDDRSHREEREEEQRKERKQDRKWAIGTVVAVLALVISALAVFIG